MLLYQSIATVAAVFSYDAPVVTHLAATSNSPPSGQACVSMEGHNFGMADTSPTVHNSSTPCVSVAWTSISSLVCSTPSLEGFVLQSKRSAWVRMRGFGRVINALFSIDALVVSAGPGSAALCDVPATGVATIPLAGSNFYATSTSRMALSIGSSSIAVAKWTSLTSILASVMPGLGIRHQPRIVAAPPVIFDAALTLTLGSSFSYDAPVVTNFAKEVHVFTF